MSRMNAAYNYDLNKYRRLSAEETAEPKRKNITINRKNMDKASTIKIILLATVALLLLFCVVYGKVQVSDMYSQINVKKTELASAESENARLKAEIESYTSLKNIEEYAEDIGLKKLDKAQIWYIDIQSEDVVEIPDAKENIFVKIKKYIDSAKEYILN